MKSRFEACYRALMGLLAAVFCVCIWTSAVGGAAPSTESLVATNAAAANPAAASTNTPAGRRSLSLLPTIDRQYLTFGLNRVPFLRDTSFAQIALWQYLASCLFILLAVLFAKVLDFAASLWIRRRAQKAGSDGRTDVLRLARGPLRMVVLVLLLHIGLSLFDWPPLVERWTSNALKIVVAVSLTYAILQVVDIALRAWRQRRLKEKDESFDHLLAPILSNAVKVVIVVMAALVTLDNLGVNITGLIASLSIGGLALSLAAQDTVANLFGAVAVLVDKPFKVGDRVRFENVDGTVEAIGLRSTRVRNLDGHLITVPNKTMGNATVTNITQRPTIRTVMNLGLTCETSPSKVERATRLLSEIFLSHPGTKEVSVTFNKFGDSSLNIEVVHVWKDTNNEAYLTGLQLMNLEILRRFAAEQIEFAFPTQTLHVRSGVPPSLAPARA